MDNISFPLKNLRSTADGKASILPMSEEENKFSIQTLTFPKHQENFKRTRS